jgi:5-hydroxyisourate hydrolase
MSPITSHVLDTAKGCPAKNIPVTLFEKKRESWVAIGSGQTNQDGRVKDLVESIQIGTYKIKFETSAYHGKNSFYPTIEVLFHIHDASQHYHIPLLLSPYGYSTYRGS